MTREQRLEIYKKMLRFAKKDLKDSRRTRLDLYGLCNFSKRCGVSIEKLPELMKYEHKNWTLYWFDTDPNGPDATKRIDILKEIINTMQNEETQKYQNS